MAIVQLCLWEDKACGKCKRVLPLSAFSRCNSKRLGVNSYCKECNSQYQRIWVKSNPEKRRVVAKRYRNVHGEKWRRWTREHRSRDAEREYYWKNPEPHRVRAKLHAHKRRTLNVGPPLTADEWTKICDKYGNRCVACGEQTKLTIDHIIPVTKGGTNAAENIQPLCRSCNSCKNNKTIDYRPA